MVSTHWEGDACSLVDAMRRGTITPPEALQMSLDAIAVSKLNATCYLDESRAKGTAELADVTLPFGGLPVGFKELDAVSGWPKTEASLLFEDRISDYDTTMTTRLKAAGVVPVGQTTASEFGGISCTNTRMHGATLNPWNIERTPGGSSGGSAASVVGGLLPLATAADGGGSIRIPAGFTGLFGLKATFGRIPKGPRTNVEPLTEVLGCVSRSVRDTARWFDVCNGADEYDPFSLPRVEGWESGLGSHDLAGLRATVMTNLGGAVVAAAVRQAVEEAANGLIKEARLRRVDVPVNLPNVGVEWAMAGTSSLLVDLGNRYPEREDLLTPEMLFACNITRHHFDLDTAMAIERARRQSIVAMADVFGAVDFIITATNPDVAFGATGPLPTTIDGVNLIDTLGFEGAVGNSGALTIPANTTGNPAVSIPIGTVEGLPVGMQVIGRHHAEPLLLDLALDMERRQPWPLTAPGAPL